MKKAIKKLWVGLLLTIMIFSCGMAAGVLAEETTAEKQKLITNLQPAREGVVCTAQQTEIENGYQVKGDLQYGALTSVIPYPIGKDTVLKYTFYINYDENGIGDTAYQENGYIGFQVSGADKVNGEFDFDDFQMASSFRREDKNQLSLKITKSNSWPLGSWEVHAWAGGSGDGTSGKETDRMNNWGELNAPNAKGPGLDYLTYCLFGNKEKQETEWGMAFDKSVHVEIGRTMKTIDSQEVECLYMTFRTRMTDYHGEAEWTYFQPISKVYGTDDKDQPLYASVVLMSNIDDIKSKVDYSITEISVEEKNPVAFDESEYKLGVGAKTIAKIGGAVGSGYRSADERVATVDSATGEITASGVGETQIIAAKDGNYAVCTVKVADVGLNREKLVLVKDKSYDIANILKITPDGLALTYKSNAEQIASISADGEITAHAAGNTQITISCAEYGIERTLEVEVLETGITIEKEELHLIVGKDYRLDADIPASVTDAVWSTDNAEIVTVTDGLVSAKAEGTANITLSSPAVNSVECKVTVLGADEGLKFENATLDIELSKTGGQTAQLQYDIKDADSRVIAYTSSDDAVAAVDANGTVTAKGVGTATITATVDGDVTASYSVNVVGDLQLSQDKIVLAMGETASLTAQAQPADLPYTFSSSDEKVVKVGADGTLTPVGAGTAVITVSGYGLSDTCNVTVIEKVIVLDKSELSLKIGGFGTLKATVNEAYEPTDSIIRWTSSDSAIASVDVQGKVTAINAGSATITAEIDGKYTATCTVTVTGGLTVANENITLKVGETGKIEATADVESGTVVYKSSDPTVVGVDSTGKLTAYKEGTAKVTVSVYGLQKEVTVTVTGETEGGSSGCGAVGFGDSLWISGAFLLLGVVALIAFRKKD